MIRVWLHSPQLVDPLSYIRAAGPFSDLESQGLCSVTYNADSLSWLDLARHDVFFIHRPHTTQHLQMIKYITDNNKPVVLDYDDNVLAVDSDNPVAGLYGPPTQAIIKACLGLASQVWVATETLAEVFRPLARQVHVIPLALDERFSFSQPASKSRVILWRGGSSHRQDLAEVAEGLHKTIQKYPDWFWVFMTSTPEIIPSAIRDLVTVRPFVDVASYYRWLGELNPRYVIVPLRDTPFSRCKAPAALLEGACAGAEVLCPDWARWRGLSAINYPAGGFNAQLAQVLKDPRRRTVPEHGLPWLYELRAMRLKCLESL